ncbi:hypothetical protein EZV62_012575 [Acer yangbiense]|uniref:DUF8039 domain-containing protein n=1 Tax=Acer yangbiense TaxID=1000413 RepID=A0A5C7HYE5_9ROSI|nr:hypothetical protein EZV62_012575 [Acer yangbiense]
MLMLLVGAFSVLRKLVVVLPDCLADHIGSLIPGIEKALNDKSSTSNLKIEALVFTRLVLSSHSPHVFYPYIKNRFGLDGIAKDHVLASMSTCWRQYKSRITKHIRNVPPGPEASRKLQLLKSDNISDIAEWNKFVKFRQSQEFDEISRRYTELAKKNETPHTTSRKGFARLREELRATKIAKNEDPDEVDRVETWIAGYKHKDGTPAEMEAIPLDKTKSIKDDVVAQVLGKEHRGQVQGLGLGVMPTKVHVAVIGKTITMQLQAKMKDLRQLINDKAAAEEKVHQSPLGVSTSEKDASPQKGTKCKLLHWIGNGQIVVEAEIDCTDPQASVHHKLFGPDYWRVCVKKIMVSDVPLILHTSELQTLEDARGTFIAWPSKYITY